MVATTTEIPVTLSEGEVHLEYRGTSLSVRPRDYATRETKVGIPFQQGREELEYNVSLKPFKARGRNNDVGEYWRLASSSPMVRDAVSAVVSAISAAPWRLERPELPTYWNASPAARAAIDRQFEFCSYVWSKWTATGASRVWSQWVEDVLRFSMVCGFRLAEVTAQRQPLTIAGATRPYLCPDIPHAIMPWTVEEWVFEGNPDTGMVAIVQQAFNQIDGFGNAGDGYKVIPWDKLIHTAFMPASAGDLEGSSIVRAAYQPLRMKQKLLQLQALGIEVNALGMIVVKQDKTSPIIDGARDTLQSDLDNFTAEMVNYVILPPGDHELEFKRPSDTIPDLTKQLDALDRIIGHALGNVHRLMALQSVGSHAARSDASSEARDAYDYMADLCAREAERVLRRFIEVNFPLDAALGMVFCPNVAHSVVEEKDNLKRAQTLATLAGAGLITPTAALEAQLLSENDVAQGKVDVES